MYPRSCNDRLQACYTGMTNQSGKMKTHITQVTVQDAVLLDEGWQSIDMMYVNAVQSCAISARSLPYLQPAADGFTTAR